MTIYPITVDDDSGRPTVTIPLYLLLDACRGLVEVRVIPGGIVVGVKTEDEDEDAAAAALVDDMIRAFSGG